LPAPTSGSYGVHWRSLFQLNDLEKASVAEKISNAMDKASNGMPETIMPPDVFSERYLSYTQDSQPTTKKAANNGTPR
jgi:hypothetical protein